MWIVPSYAPELRVVPYFADGAMAYVCGHIDFDDQSDSAVLLIVLSLF